MFYGIKIKNSNVYFTIFGKDGRDEFKWGKEKDSLSFGTPKEASNFAENYFKKFKDWEVVELNLEFN